MAVLTFFGITLAARWRDVTARKWEPDPGYLVLATILLAVSYAMVAALWAAALRRAAGLGLARGMRIWFGSNLARYVPGNVWSFVGAVELARRDGVPRRTTLAVMTPAQLLSVGTALLVGLPVLVAGRTRLGPAVALGGLAVAAYAAAYAVGFLSLVPPAGLGVREGVLTVALAQIMPAGAALAVALLSRLWMMLVELLGAGLMQLLGRDRGARQVTGSG